MNKLSIAALQRVIPHDIRIDYVPGASIRDRMIIFQDYYNMDDCFQFLSQNTVFMGGDVRDTRNWVIDPEYSLKFWFLSHQLVDQSYDECIDAGTSSVVHEELFKRYDSSSDVEEMVEVTNNMDNQPTTNIPFINSTCNGVNDFNKQQHQSVYFREL